MFLGTIPTEAKALIHEQVAGWRTDDVHVACSGALSIERTLKGQYRLHGNDVNLYSCSLGALYAGEELRMEVRENWKGEFGWLEPYLKDAVSKTAVVLLCSQMLNGLGRVTPYHLRMRAAWFDQWDRVFEQTVDKLKSTDLKLESFYIGDAVDWMLALPQDSAVLSFPPFFCLAPSERVLTADLRWVPCGDLREGDELLAFTEHTIGGRNRRWQYATVTHSAPAVAECVRVHLADGSSVICTEDHPWLADKAAYSTTGSRDWVRADRLLETAPYVHRLLDTWSPATSYDAGWLAGMFDGEGSVHTGQAAKMTLTQKQGAVADRVEDLLRGQGFTAWASLRPGGVKGIEVAGGFPEILRALGTIRPDRLITNLRARDEAKLPSTRSHGDPRVRVIAVERIGKHAIQSLSTSTHTYIGEGFAMHNTGGYETMFKALSAVFDWDEPEYPILDDERHEMMVQAIMSKRLWVYGSKDRRPELEPYLRCLIQTTNRNLPMFFYSSGGATRTSMPWQQVEPVLAPRLTPGKTIGGRMALAALTPGQFAGLRSQYLNASIAPGIALLPLAVIVDSVVVGCFALSLGKFGSGAYMISDFPVAPTDYPRLSKLIVMAALSREAKLLFERTSSKRTRELSTTAFSMNPESGKYRGLLKLGKRQEVKNPHHRFQLEYNGEMGRWSLAEGLELWKRKHGKRVEEKSDGEQRRLGGGGDVDGERVVGSGAGEGGGDAVAGHSAAVGGVGGGECGAVAG